MKHRFNRVLRRTLVSILIPCYNAEKYVGEAIRSALDQSYSNIEVIVIDDGSTDGSLDVIRSFGDAIRWETGENRGGCAARNRGIALARGELVQFLDADDLLYPEKLTRQVPSVLAKKADIVYCSTRVQRFGRCSHGPWIDSTEIQGDPVVTLLGAQIGTQAPVHRKWLLQSIGGFRNRLPCAQEFDLHLRLACNGATFHHVPEVLVSERKFSGSVSGNTIRVREQQRRILWRAHGQLKKSGKLTEERAAAFAAFLACGARVLLSLGAVHSAIWNLRVARSMYPSGGLDELFYSRSGRLASRVIGPVPACRLAILKERVASWVQGNHGVFL